jgi:hypothetical protein
MLKLWRQRPVLVSGFLLAVALTLFFATRLVVHGIYWANPAHHNQQVRDWMTVGYIARSWDLPAPALDAQTGFPGPKVKGHPQTLREIAEDRGVAVTEVIAEAEAAIAQLKAEAAIEKLKVKVAKP